MAETSFDAIAGSLNSNSTRDPVEYTYPASVDWADTGITGDMLRQYRLLIFVDHIEPERPSYFVTVPASWFFMSNHPSLTYTPTISTPAWAFNGISVYKYLRYINGRLEYKTQPELNWGCSIWLIP